MAGPHTHELFGIKRQAGFADEAVATGQIRGGDDGPLQLGAEVIDIDSVVREETVGTGAVVDVRIVMVRGIGFAFDKDDLLEASSA